MTEALGNDHLLKLLGAQEPPCLSLYQGTHRRHPGNQQDPVRFRNLLKVLEESLRGKFGTREVTPLLAPFRSLARLFEGNRDALDEIELAQGVSRTITEALGEKLSDPHLTVSSHGTGPGRPGGGLGGAGMGHGHGGKKDEVDIDRERFSRSVDRGILEHHSRRTGLPLILAPLPQHHAPLRSVSHNPFLAAEGIRINPGSLSADQLRESAWRVVEPSYHARVALLVAEFGASRGRSLAAADLSDIAVAAVSGRVGTLLVEAARRVPGRVNAEDGRIRPEPSADPEIDDLLDDVAELVLKKNGRVVIVPAERMPTDTGLAATYRF